MEVAHAHAVFNGEVQPPEIADGLQQHIGYDALCQCGHSWVPRGKTASAVIDVDPTPLTLTSGIRREKRNRTYE